MQGLKRTMRWLVILLLPLCLSSLSCNRYERPRTKDDIFNDRIAVDTLYLTEDGEQVIAPGTVRGVIVTDEKKLAFEAWQCNNPACPGRQAGGDPFLFPWPDRLAYIADDGTPAIRQPTTAAELKQMEEFANQRCPACLKIRKPASETPAEREKYRNWLQLHVLPQAEKRLKQLDEEQQAYLKRQAESQQPASK